ncbi:Uncharacterised protein [Citrobacter freundii]|nr:Uncharacterised protein [Citrobacter freundii]
MLLNFNACFTCFSTAHYSDIFFCDKYYLIYSAFIGFVFIFELALFAFVRK